METLVALLLIGAVVLFWADSQGAKERALAVCAKACAELDVQLLDQTVSLARVRLARTAMGRVQWRRTFTFEFSINRVDRHRGQAILLGRAVELVELDHPDGLVILQRSLQG